MRIILHIDTRSQRGGFVLPSHHWSGGIGHSYSFTPRLDPTSLAIMSMHSHWRPTWFCCRFCLKCWPKIRAYNVSVTEQASQHTNSIVDVSELGQLGIRLLLLLLLVQMSTYSCERSRPKQILVGFTWKGSPKFAGSLLLESQRIGLGVVFLCISVIDSPRWPFVRGPGTPPKWRDSEKETSPENLLGCLWVAAGVLVFTEEGIVSHGQWCWYIGLGSGSTRRRKSRDCEDHPRGWCRSTGDCVPLIMPTKLLQAARGVWKLQQMVLGVSLGTNEPSMKRSYTTPQGLGLIR